VCAAVQTAVQDLLRTFDNTSYNNPITGYPANDVTDAAAAATGVVRDDVQADGEVYRRPPLAAVNQTQNNDTVLARYDDDCAPGEVSRPVGPVARRQPSYHRQDQVPANTWRHAAVRRSISLTGARHARSSSLLGRDGPASARNAASSASLTTRQPASRDRLDSSEQHPNHRRCSSSASLSRQQHYHQPQWRRQQAAGAGQE